MGYVGWGGGRACGVEPVWGVWGGMGGRGGHVWLGGRHVGSKELAGREACEVGGAEWGTWGWVGSRLCGV